MLVTWVRSWWKLRPESAGSTVELSSGGRLRVFADGAGTCIEVTSPPDAHGRTQTARVQVSGPEATEIQQAVGAARFEATLSA